ncbi:MULTISPECIES: SAM-dependent methyltransferase [unclassified Streptomyces]|uniref:SAM-dependent methyltransferase n=1 Tax=unclassified Streptomyces TaxID=2593676 RepID=UPI0022534CC9|nr:MULTISPECIES: SAM-dependent methyltransferase [unclassified Streptomyces]MCX5142769.1 SAM-dependent methyltransferase [Streptomyces sp. NBC_00338]WRZ67203.1 SAM-dependent methyltransferase [Streptomyces sp. NBC_01257]WSU61216.1 SAM-dependent methyltransferase [Streptomyces sp. NBC_01104]
MSADAPAPDATELRKRIDTTKAHPARVYDVFLGGKDNYPADREAAAMALAANPRGYLTVRHNRDFMRRAVTLAAHEGIRQFLDIGTGLPTQQNVHQIAQAVAPDSRVVYVDNDPVVLVHAQALLTSGPEGRTDYIEADLRDPATILEAARRTLDLDRPVALVLAAVLHFIEDDAAYPVVERLLGALAPGSLLVLSNVSSDLNPEQVGQVTKAFKERGFAMVRRSHAQVERFVTDNGLEMLEPGVVPVHRWRPEEVVDLPEAADADPEFVAGLDELDRTRYRRIDDVTDADVSVYGVVARKL